MTAQLSDPCPDGYEGWRLEAELKVLQLWMSALVRRLLLTSV
jgi:hypothetical protein